MTKFSYEKTFTLKNNRTIKVIVLDKTQEPTHEVSRTETT